jgi:uncharacterized protein (TIGR03437 family)
MLAALAAAQPPSYSIRTLAGHDAVGDGGLAVNALLPVPTKVAIDSSGTIYVSQTNGDIRRITPDGVISTLATVTNAYGVAIDTSGGVLVATQDTCLVRRVNLQTGALSNIAGNGKCGASADGPAGSVSFLGPNALAFDPQGRLLIADQYNYRIRRLDFATGQVVTIAGTGAVGQPNGDEGPAISAQIGQPTDFAVNAHGDVFFTDGQYCRVRRIDAAGVIHAVSGSGACGFAGDSGPASAARLDSPRSLALNAAGNLLYVGETGAGRIRVINLDTGQIATFAGTGTAGDSGDGSSASRAQLNTPWGLAFDKSGGLLVAEYFGGHLRRIDSYGTITTLAGAPSDGGDGGPAQAATLSNPNIVAADGKGGYFVSDSGNRRIRAASGGVISLLAGATKFSGSNGDNGPALSAGLALVYGMTADPNGTIYFTEASGAVRRFKPGGAISRIGSTNLNFPQGIAIDPVRQVLYVAEFSGSRITRIDLATSAFATFAGLGNPGDGGTPGLDGDGSAVQHKLSGPNQLALDAQGNVYVLDTGNQRIRKINPGTGAMTTIAGNGQNSSSGDGGPATAAGVTSLSGITVDSAGNIFFAEGARIRRIDSVSGVINTVAGTGAAGFSGDGGPALSAQISSAGGLSADTQGNIYFADLANQRVRVLSPPIAGPRIAAAIVAANFGAGLTIAPASWVEIYGEKLSATTRQWAGSDFIGNQAPTSLDNVRVQVNGKAAFVNVISAGQINVAIPDGIGTGNVTLQVANPVGTSDPILLTAADRSPALLAPPAFGANGRHYVAALFPDGSFVGRAGLVPGAAFQPAKAGDRIVLYGIGFGAVTPPVAAGQINTQSTSLANFHVQIGGVEAVVEYAGLAGGFVGLYQINLVVPAGVSGDALLSVTVDGVPVRQTLFLTLQ